MNNATNRPARINAAGSINTITDIANLPQDFPWFAGRTAKRTSPYADASVTTVIELNGMSTAASSGSRRPAIADPAASPLSRHTFQIA